MKAQMESWQDIQEYVKNNKKKHKRRMANDAMKNVNDIAFMKLKNKELAQVIQAFSQWALEQEEL